MASPLIFIHYGDAPYLAQTLQTARRTNPEKRIVLLGDAANRRYARNVAEHVCFDDLAGGEDLAVFDRVFQVIQGGRHRFNKLRGTEFWLRFVFRRWFLVANFLEREKIDAFWTFDSDTLILAPLASREARFSGYDCTEQCRGECLNGFVRSSQLARAYVRTINQLFQDPDFLDAQRRRLETHAGLAFNEMDAYCEFRHRSNLRSIRASEPIDGETFDDALAFVDEYEQAPQKVLERTSIKRLWTSPQGGLFARRQTGEIIRLLTANLSWMPAFIYQRVSALAVSPERDSFVTPSTFNDLSELSYSEPALDAAWRKLRLKLYPLEKTAYQWLKRTKLCR
jgi:hypothetical protein